MFRKELNLQINELVMNLNHRILIIPENWHWLDYKNQAELFTIRKEDVDLAKKLNQLHAQGKDIPALNLRMLQLCNDLHQHLENIMRDKKINLISEEGKKIKQIIAEISQIYSREFSIMQRESAKLLYDNRAVQLTKDRIIKELNSKNASWSAIREGVYALLTTRKMWTEGIINEVKFKEYDKVYKNMIASIETEVNKNTQMRAGEEGGWFHIETTPKMPGKANFLGFSFKQYVTIDFSSVWDMLKNLLKLADSIRQIGLKYQDNIKIKIPPHLLGVIFISFTKHSDSIVIHYHNPIIKNEIKTAFQKWLSDHKIKSIQRDYGRAEHSRDLVNTSFSDNVAAAAIRIMQQNYSKMSNEALAIAGINYAFKMSVEGL